MLRRHGRPPQKAAALSLVLLRRLLATCDRTPRGRRDRALLLFGFAWTAWMIVDVLPFWKDDALITPDPWHMYYLDLKRCMR